MKTQTNTLFPKLTPIEIKEITTVTKETIDAKKGTLVIFTPAQLSRIQNSRRIFNTRRFLVD